jgi:hypothetical protein
LLDGSGSMQGLGVSEGFGGPFNLDAMAATHVVRSMRPVNLLHSDSVLQCPTHPQSADGRSALA